MHFLDYLIIALVLCISSLIGVYYRMTGNRQQHLNVQLSLFFQKMNLESFKKNSS